MFTFLTTALQLLYNNREKVEDLSMSNELALAALPNVQPVQRIYNGVLANDLRFLLSPLAYENEFWMRIQHPRKFFLSNVSRVKYHMNIFHNKHISSFTLSWEQTKFLCSFSLSKSSRTSLRSVRNPLSTSRSVSISESFSCCWFP